jgi:hypothetical protein
MAVDNAALKRAATTATLKPGDDRRHWSVVMEASKRCRFLNSLSRILLAEGGVQAT